MKFKFTQLPDKLPYPPNLKAQLSTMHSSVVEKASRSYNGTFSQRREIVRLMNSISYCLINNDTLISSNWNPDDPFSFKYIIDDETAKDRLGSLYLLERDIIWDLSISSDSNVDVGSPSRNINEYRPPLNVSTQTVSSQTLSSYTDKSDLYIQSPKIPQFNYNKVWMSREIDDCRYTIYCSEPEIPKKQNEISVTTDVNKMLYSDLMKLYPNQFIRTRSSSMYERVQGIEFDSSLGNILPISGFTKNQILDNIVKYPHIFRLMKFSGNDIVSFYTTIEIDGELLRISDVWKDLPESRTIPYNADFIKEYVVRRYLLERDVLKLNHKYPMYGELDPYLTLFMPADDYIRLGYRDVEEIARNCVRSRVRYKQSRNPIIKRLKNV